MGAGISEAILELAGRERLSATSAFVTLDRWPDDARRLREVRDRIAVGLHINLTFGAPLGPMPSIAPGGRLPNLLALALSRRIHSDEIAAEVTRQLARFEAEFGFAPDHVDGHQHVHALPRVRDGVLAALAAYFPDRLPLVRNPADHPSKVFARHSTVGKSLLIALLSFGFGRAAHALGFTINTSFAGVSSFDRRKPYAQELTAALSAATGRHLIMCHPGRADCTLREIDPICARREDEYDAIARYAALPSLLWRPERQKDGPSVDWKRV
jgi:predicted glycoside hydrolase/deacetylase ChbG (UPF0249 family)